MLHPNQYSVNEAWIAFQLNDVPIRTDLDGTFNCLALMDAASCFLLGSVFVEASADQASPTEVRRLIKEAKAHKNQLPKSFLVAREHAQTSIEREAARLKIEIVRVPEIELRVFIAEAQEGFREHFGAGKT
jgi:phosphoribosylanthranilate isomerase